MQKLLFLAVLAAGATAMAAAQRTVVIPVNKTAANDGQQMYTSYCAPCHGVDGRGNGPKAAALTYAPTDLTQLSRDNNGTFPALHVSSVVKFGLDSRGEEMPGWHRVLNELDQSNGPVDISVLRINNIVRYVETLQAH